MLRIKYKSVVHIPIMTWSPLFPQKENDLHLWFWVNLCELCQRPLSWHEIMCAKLKKLNSKTDKQSTLYQWNLLPFTWTMQNKWLLVVSPCWFNGIPKVIPPSNQYSRHEDVHYKWKFRIQTMFQDQSPSIIIVMYLPFSFNLRWKAIEETQWTNDTIY